MSYQLLMCELCAELLRNAAILSVMQLQFHKFAALTLMSGFRGALSYAIGVGGHI